MMSDTAIGEISRCWQQRRTSSQCQCGWTCWQSCLLTKEFNFNPSPSDVTITQQTQDLIVAKGLQDCGACFWTKRNDRHTKLATQFSEPFKKFGRFNRFDDNGHLVA